MVGVFSYFVYSNSLFRKLTQTDVLSEYDEFFHSKFYAKENFEYENDIFVYHDTLKMISGRIIIVSFFFWRLMYFYL